MGEKSKNSGELGEKYIGDFLDLIGWSTPQYGIDIPCDEPAKHKSKDAKGGRTEHGVDIFFPYESPMDSGALIHVVGSVKHTDKKYPANSNSKLKENITDLAHAIECIADSVFLAHNRLGFECTREQIIGVLFWISSHKEDENTSVLSRISNPAIDEQLRFERLHIVDNDRIQFITKSIHFIDSTYPEHTRTFHYIDTPNNLTDGKKFYDGDVLPIEMLSSDIQVFKLAKKEEITLAIVSKGKFHEDHFKRVLGLAHRVSNNLTSNVSIFFPDFEHSVVENKNAVNRIKGQFREATFIDRVLVAGYGIGFKGKINHIETSSIVPKDEIPVDQPDNGKILPYGEHLRSLLTSSLITDTELKKFLRNKGIYFCEPRKESMIPVMSSMLLSPIDFDDLRDKQKTREDREKRYTSKFETSKSPNVVEIKKALKKFNLNEIDQTKFKNYQYKKPIVSFGSDDSKLTLEYEIERYQGNKSWDQQRDVFEGSVILDCSGSSIEIVTNNISTSKETSEINQKIINEIKSRLITNGIISKNTKELKILMNDITNEDVLKFLLSFTDSSSMADLDFLEISSIDIELDDTLSLPSDDTLKWMEGKIQKLKLDGKKIEDIEILTNKKHHMFLKCWGLTAKYNLSGSCGLGHCEVDFRFNQKHKNEFFVQIPNISYDKKNFSLKNITNIVMLNIDSIKHKKHKEIMDAK